MSVTKPGTNRNYEINEKTLEEQTFFGASCTCLTNLLMSFVLKLLEVFFKQKNKPWILQEFGILLSTEPTFNNYKMQFFYFKF